MKVAFIDSQKQAIDDEMKNVFYTGSDIDEVILSVRKASFKNF